MLPVTQPAVNNRSLAAVLHALKTSPPFAQINFITDSKYVINGLTINSTRWEKRGWIGIANKEFFKPTLARLRKRGAVTTFQWIKGHNGNDGNEGADTLAGEGALKTQPDEIDISIDPNFNLTGAQLSSITQSLAYRGIMEEHTTKIRTATLTNLDITRFATQDAWGRLPKDHNIWMSLRKPDISRNIRAFLWKTLHGAHKVGAYWRNIPEHEIKGECNPCDELDSMEHILTNCDIPGQSLIWELAKNLWSNKNHPWPEIRNLGSIIRCGLAEFKTNEDKPDAGANRFYRILVSESAFLIWKLRCNRVIVLGSDENIWPSADIIKKKWRSALERRLTLDKAMTSKRFGNKALKRSLVIDTWKGTLQNESSLPDDWLNICANRLRYNDRERHN